MYKILTVAVAGLMGLPLTTALVPAKPPKDCKCYTATTTVTPDMCIDCVNPTPINCFVLNTVTTTIPGPNPTCSTTETVTKTSDCPCVASTCPEAWETVTGKFTCKRGGTKQTGVGGPAPEVTNDIGLPTTTSVADAGTTGMMSILPIDMGTPVDGPSVSATPVPLPSPISVSFPSGSGSA